MDDDMRETIKRLWSAQGRKMLDLLMPGVDGGYSQLQNEILKEILTHARTDTDKHVRTHFQRDRERESTPSLYIMP